MKHYAIFDDVSRETLELLSAYESLVTKWNNRINLVSKATLPKFFQRHVIDSAQLFNLSDTNSIKWLDLGSGAGLPGIVVAIVSKELAPNRNVELVESDKRKCIFLKTAIRELLLACQVTNERIEHVEERNADVVSARALAPLPNLLTYVDRHLSPDGVALLHKGKTWQNEIDEAKKTWKFDFEPHKSVVDPQSVILRIRNLRHA